MPFCGRKFNGSDYIGSRWSSFLDLSHGRNIRLPHTHAHTHTHTHTHTHSQTRTHPICSPHLQHDRDGGIERGGVYLPGISGTKGSYFSALFSVFSLSLSLFRLTTCVCVCVSCPPVFSIFLFGSPFSGFPQTPSGSSGRWSCRLTNLVTRWRKVLMKNGLLQFLQP